MDLSKCFDRLDHEQIIKSVNRKVSDGKVLKLIRQFLKAGIMRDGKYEATEVGSPQGGVISPLLANVYLDEFDQKMKRKGIRIVRYADDILIFARSPRGAKKNLQIAKEILEDELKLTINKKKTKITQVGKGVEYLIANCKKVFQGLAEWIRRRLRMKQMKEWKSWKPLFKALRRNGYKREYKKISMTRWRKSVSPLIHRAIPNKWFDDNGLVNLGTYETGILSHYYE